jgi:hypothetical protein
MVWVQWALLDEFEKEVIDWSRVCMLVNASPSVCRVKDEYGMYPLHFACYANAPLYVIQLLMRTWEDAIKEDIVYDGHTTIYNEWGTLNLACDADAPLEVIQYLVDTTSRSGIPVTDEALRIVIERKRELNVVCCVAPEWPWSECIYDYCLPDNESERALYRLENNCPDLGAIRIGWPLPRKVS